MSKTRRKERARAVIDAMEIGVDAPPEVVAELNELTGWSMRAYRRVLNTTNPKDTRCLSVSIDGTIFSVWSWVKAIDGYNTDKNLYAAMREAIKPQVLAFAETAQLVCAECGNTDDLTVDHKAPTFKEMASRFVETNPGLSDRLSNHDNGGGWFINDADSNSRWREYHKQNATYQMLCRSCNSRKGANARNRQTHKIKP